MGLMLMEDKEEIEVNDWKEDNGEYGGGGGFSGEEKVEVEMSSCGSEPKHILL